MLSQELDALKDSISCCTFNGAQHSHVMVEENDPAASLRKITLVSSGGNWFSFDPDEGRKCKRIHNASNVVVMSPLLAIPGHDHHRACDCVVVLCRGTDLSVLYIDLKSENPKGYAGQFKSTRQFVRYAVNLLAEFHGINLHIKDERYVIFYGGKPLLINKTTTVPKREGMGRTHPDAAYKRRVSNSATLHLKEFLC
jgi:hypothetical protein